MDAGRGAAGEDDENRRNGGRAISACKAHRRHMASASARRKAADRAFGIVCDRGSTRAVFARPFENR